MYSLYNDFEPKEWNSYLDADERATVYHTLEWRSVLEDAFHFETAYTICLNSRGEAVAILPIAFVKSWITGKRVISLPFSQYGGLLLRDAEALPCIVSHLRTYLDRGFEYVRLRTRERFDLLASLGLKSSDYYSRCVIPLTGRSVEDIWRGMDRKSVRWAIEASSRQGILTYPCEGGSDVNRLNELMLQTCKKHGIPPYSPRLFIAICNLLLPKKLAKIFVARLAEKIVAVLVLFTMNKESIYAYNFSDMKYLKLRSNNALIWAAIKWSVDNDMRRFDMGISSPEDGQLLGFKMRWGATHDKVHEYLLARGDKVISPDRRGSLKYKSATFAWRFLMPSIIASKIGPPLLSHFG